MFDSLTSAHSLLSVLFCSETVMKARDVDALGVAWPDLRDSVSAYDDGWKRT